MAVIWRRGRLGRTDDLEQLLKRARDVEGNLRETFAMFRTYLAELEEELHQPHDEEV